MPFHSLDVSLFGTVTLGTISLAGAAVLATHAGVGFGFFGGIVLCRLYLELGCCGQKIHASSHNSRRRKKKLDGQIFFEAPVKPRRG